MGYHRAGFDVIGVDNKPQPNYPFEFVQADWLPALTTLLLERPIAAIHASPPCQRFSTATSSTGSLDDHLDLVAPVRRRLKRASVPYVIENVSRAPLRRDVLLCGSMFGMAVRRHRVFELGGWFLLGAPSCDHKRQGRTVDVTGNAGGPDQTDRPGYPIKWRNVDHAREVMGMPWASGTGCTEAIPPADTEFIGGQLIDHLT
jgi:DNA (cytosine-5)-methyltransferase 1